MHVRKIEIKLFFGLWTLISDVLASKNISVVSLKSLLHGCLENFENLLIWGLVVINLLEDRGHMIFMDLSPPLEILNLKSERIMVITKDALDIVSIINLANHILRHERVLDPIVSSSLDGLGWIKWLGGSAMHHLDVWAMILRLDGPFLGDLCHYWWFSSDLHWASAAHF